ncbi:hypothetical protein EDD15DRAFT_1793510 [Pisolithus albus]|nr:hypothetical protein EDD15DRAFT_1793510 [Pisolithus albus]
MKYTGSINTKQHRHGHSTELLLRDFTDSTHSPTTPTFATSSGSLSREDGTFNCPGTDHHVTPWNILAFHRAVLVIFSPMTTQISATTPQIGRPIVSVTSSCAACRFALQANTPLRIHLEDRHIPKWYRSEISIRTCGRRVCPDHMHARREVDNIRRVDWNGRNMASVGVLRRKRVVTCRCAGRRSMGRLDISQCFKRRS